jgi:hypothetical protein
LTQLRKKLESATRLPPRAIKTQGIPTTPRAIAVINFQNDQRTITSALFERSRDRFLLPWIFHPPGEIRRHAQLAFQTNLKS